MPVVMRSDTCVICGMSNGYFSWLFLVVANIIREKLLRVTLSHFSAFISSGRCTTYKSVFNQTYAKLEILSSPLVLRVYLIQNDYVV